jgi:hypothetical protein
MQEDGGAPMASPGPPEAALAWLPARKEDLYWLSSLLSCLKKLILQGVKLINSRQGNAKSFDHHICIVEGQFIQYEAMPCSRTL